MAPTDRSSPRTLTGRLAEPVAGCPVVETAAGRWALVGDLGGAAVGDRVEVEGLPDPRAETPTGAPVLRVRAVRVL